MDLYHFSVNSLAEQVVKNVFTRRAVTGGIISMFLLLDNSKGLRLIYHVVMKTSGVESNSLALFIVESRSKLHCMKERNLNV